MSNQVSQDMAVAFMLGRDKAEREQELRAMFEKGYRKPTKPKAEKTPRVKREKKAPVSVRTAIAPQMYFKCEPGSIGPEGFLKLLRNARDRREKIEAIHSYIGYDVTGDFGAQEYRAKAQAQKEIKPISTSEKVMPTVRGYVAGMPDNASRFRADLKARERNAVEAHIEHSWAAEKASDDMGKKLHSGLAEVEKDRLRAIRQDLHSGV